jgi:hypothetical protein
MFIYKELSYDRYTYDTIRLGINLTKHTTKHTTKLKHTYTGLDRKEYNTVITEPQEIVQFLEHLLALAQPAKDWQDEQNIKTIQPLLNQMYGYIKSPETKPDDNSLQINLNTWHYIPHIVLPCVCGTEHKQAINAAGKASKNFTTGEEKLELLQGCPKTGIQLMGYRTPIKEYRTVYQQNSLDLNQIPEKYKKLWQPHYPEPTQI